jgi:hypothetical protein
VIDVEGDKGTSGPGAVSSRSNDRHVSDKAAVIPERCSTRPARTAERSTFHTDIAEAADPARQYATSCVSVARSPAVRKYTPVGRAGSRPTDETSTPHPPIALTR